ncbi:MAG: S-layer homology domain-containing protein, partial [Bifidobacteriaceae bacterium]|nr:S-layer homology domain-containing protein [Bifidobacteriaceae bacterium]
KFTFANIRLDSEQELTRIISSIDSIAPTFRILGAPRFREKTYFGIHLGQTQSLGIIENLFPGSDISWSGGIVENCDRPNSQGVLSGCVFKPEAANQTEEKELKISDNSFKEGSFAVRKYKVYVPKNFEINPRGGSVNGLVTISGEGFLPGFPIYFSGCGIKGTADKNVGNDGKIQENTTISLNGCSIGENEITISDFQEANEYNSLKAIYTVSNMPIVPTSVNFAVDNSVDKGAKLEIHLGSFGLLPDNFVTQIFNTFGASTIYNLSSVNGGENCKIDGICIYSIPLKIAGKYTARVKSVGGIGESEWIQAETSLVLSIEKVKFDIPAFVDIAKYSLRDNIIWAYNYGITTGTDAMHFAPTKFTNRGQMAAFLHRIAGSPFIDNNIKTPFSDIANYLSVDTIKWLVNAGITTGTDATHYSPAKSVNRNQMATFLYRLAGKPAIQNLNNPFKDINGLTADAKTAIIWLASTGITTGTDATHYSPKGNVTRGQMAVFMNRFAKKGEYIN